jgi:hypothetical protein
MVMYRLATGCAKENCGTSCQSWGPNRLRSGVTISDCYGLNKCPPHSCSKSGLQLVTLYWEVWETLGGEAWLEKVGYWGVSLKALPVSLLPGHHAANSLLWLRFLTTMTSALPQAQSNCSPDHRLKPWAKINLSSRRYLSRKQKLTNNWWKLCFSHKTSNRNFQF